MNETVKIKQFLPIMFGFFVMGFIDIVGIASNYIKQDFHLSDTVANLLLMLVYIWFFLFSIPTGVLMGKIGRRKTVILSILITSIALFVPIVSFNFAAVLLSLSLLGIGNTILQVSLNPFVGDIVSDSKLASSLTLGQFVKAISSFIGPLIVGFATLYLGNWRFLFPIFGTISVFAAIWLGLVKVNETNHSGKRGTFIESISLLGDPVILGLFVGILFVVGIDVGLNVSIPKYLMLKGNLPLTEAGLGISLYFAAKTTGAFLGAILLSRVSANKFYPITVILAIVSLAFTILVQSVIGIYFGIFLLGLTVSNIFSIIFFKAMLHKPAFRNEISGLMMMGIIGGAFIPLLMGLVADSFGQNSSLLVLMVCLFYLLMNSLRKIKTTKI